MPSIIDYILKFTICLAVVYIFYQLFLRRLTFYNWNRWYLLGYSALSFIIPLIDIMPQLQKREMDSSSILQWIPVLGAPVVEKTFFETLTYWDWALIVIVTGTVIFLLRFLIKLISFLLLKKKATLISSAQTRLYQLNENITPFSFGNAIYINRHLHTEAELQEIIRHEFVHVKQNHTLDIIFCELLCILNWFNPFAWLIRHSVKQNLEFIADDKVVQNGFDKKEYQYLLLKVMGNKQFAFTNHFNFSNLKKRIKMMNTLKTAKVHLIKFLFLLPVVAVLLLSFRKEIQKAEVKASSNFLKDTIPDADSGYKISVITTPGGFDNRKMNRNVIDRMSLEDWNKNKEFYEKKYGQKAPVKVFEQEKDGKMIRYDSVYVTKFKPKPIKPGEEPLILLDGNELPYASMNSIPPDEIKSVSVLKDASATSLYGDKGKNGAIQIITHNGYRPQGFKKNQDNVISIRGEEKPLTILDGKEISYEESKTIKGEDIKTINILKDKAATLLYGENGKNGVIIMKSKETSKGRFKLDDGRDILIADSVAVHDDGKIVFMGSVSGTISSKKSQNIDASKNVHKYYNEAVVKGHKIQNNLSSAIFIVGNENPHIILDGKEITKADVNNVNPDNIESISVLKNKPATTKYGDKGKNGVVEISTKKLKEK